MKVFTPGPWAIEPLIVGSKEFVVVAVDPAANGSTVIATRICGPDAEANACLVAAAPSMLAALKQSAKWLRGWATAEPYLSEIEAAIAKAEGKP